MLIKSTNLITAILLTSTTAYGGNYSVDMGISTFGLTITPGYRLNENIGFRAPIGMFSTSTTLEDGGTSLDATATIGGVGMLADYYIMNDGFRITGGVMKPLYKVDAKGKGTSVELEGNTYGVSDFSAELRASNIAPYLGIGYQYGDQEGWGAALDYGAMFNVKYSGKYDYTPIGLTAAEIASLNADADTYLNDALKDLNDMGAILPFISISASYRF